MMEEQETYEQILFRLKGRNGDKFTELCRPKKGLDREIQSHECKEISLTLADIKARREAQEMGEPIKQLGKKLF